MFFKVAVNTPGEDLPQSKILPLTPKSKIKHISTGLIQRPESATAIPMMYLQAADREVPVNI